MSGLMGAGWKRSDLTIDTGGLRQAAVGPSFPGVVSPSPLRQPATRLRQGNSSAEFGAIDAYVHERVARLASRKHGLRGFHWSARFTWEWLGNLGIYRLTGTVRYPAAHALR